MFEVIMVKFFPKLMTDMKPDSESSENIKNLHLRIHILKKSQRQGGVRNHLPDRGTRIRITLLHWTSLQKPCKQEWSKKVLKENNHQPTILYLKNYPSKAKEKQRLADKQIFQKQMKNI